jgi:hypothetical protein
MVGTGSAYPDDADGDQIADPDGDYDPGESMSAIILLW